MSAPLLDTLQGPCRRCGTPCRVAGPGNPEATLLRLSAKPDGQCVCCAVREWFYVHREAVPDFEPEELLHPWIREQFTRIMFAGHADAKPDEIDWKRVVAEWHLPIPGAEPPRKARRARTSR